MNNTMSRRDFSDGQVDNRGGFTSYFLAKVAELPSSDNNFRLQSVQSSHPLDAPEALLHYNPSTTDNSRFGGTVSFPFKLYRCLEDAEILGYTDVISWQPDGASFKVQDQDRFIQEVLPQYFGSIKFKSWQRQLNLYGFTRVHKGLTRGSYTHSQFVRGGKSLSLEISRQKLPHLNDPSGGGPSNPSPVVMPTDTKQDTERMISFLNQGSDTERKQQPFTSNYVQHRGNGWMNDTLINKGTIEVSHRGGSNAFFDTAVQHHASSSNSGCSSILSNIDIDAISVSSSESATMPSAQEMSFLLNADEQQLGNAHGRLQTAFERGSHQIRQCSSMNTPRNPVIPSLHDIANTMPLACDLTADLSGGTSTPLGTSVLPRQPLLVSSHAVAMEHQQVCPGSTKISSEPRSFPWKLHELLCEAEKNGFHDIISWEPDGMAFKVHDCHLFVERVMPLYFDQSRYESFRRQLRKYGFSRLHKDRYRGAYHHRNFQRFNKNLCEHITRGNANKKAAEAKKKAASIKASLEAVDSAKPISTDL